MLAITIHVSLVIALTLFYPVCRFSIVPSAESIQSVDTVYSADSIEFSPVQHDIFVCGTYQIQKLDEIKDRADTEALQRTADDKSEDSEGEGFAAAPRTRRLGRALVYQVAEDGQSLCVRNSGVTYANCLLKSRACSCLLSQEIQRFDGPAILDTKW